MINPKLNRTDETSNITQVHIIQQTVFISNKCKGYNYEQIRNKYAPYI